MLFSKIKPKDIHPVIVDTVLIRRVTEFNYLGLVLDEHLDWSNHVDHVRAKIFFAVKMIRRSRKILHFSQLLTIYFSLYTLI